MKGEKEKTTFKAYHIFIIACILSPLLILNSNYVNNRKEKIKTNEGNSKLFDQIILGRQLEGVEGDEGGAKTGTDKICEKGHDDLVEYYKTGDLGKIGLDDKPIKAEDKDEPYLQSLIKIIKSLSGGGDDSKKERLRNLQSFDAIQDDLITYLKHLLPILAFFVIAILAIPGWIICCFCCCCNCCCCCCCKKPGCKLPCFIFTNAFYALVVAVCIYGLSQSNNIFEGMASTECSILKFFDQVIDGETKSELPRWAGIDPINDILDDLGDQINHLNSNINSQLNTKFNDIYGVEGDASKPGSKKKFKEKMNDAGDIFRDSSGNINSGYKKDCSDYTGQTPSDFFVLDLVTFFGRHTGSETYDGIYSTDSILSAWQIECNTISQSADDNLKEAKKSFSGILDSNAGKIIENLDNGKKTLGELKDSFNGIKSGIADLIIDNSETIDEKGKLGFKLVFGVLALINVAIAAFMFLICFFSGKLCAKCCCCCRCIFKCATHLLWNILALLMIITFLVGFLFALVGQIGSDAMSVISYIVSEDNLGPNGDNFLVDNLGNEGKGYIYRCVDGDGKIEEEIGLEMNQINSFNQLYDAEDAIKQSKEAFEKIQREMPTYYKTIDQINDRVDLKVIPQLFSTTDPCTSTSCILNYDKILKDLNDSISSSAPNDDYKREKWVIGSPSDNRCEEGLNPDNSGNDVVSAGNYIFNPLKCDPKERDWIIDSGTDATIKKHAEMLSKIMGYVKEANTEATPPNPNPQTFLEVLNQLKGDYNNIFLKSYIDALDLFKSSIHLITRKLKDFTGDNNGLFSFIKCTFIGTNLKIMLKYLKSALGGDVKTVGICLLVVGCSLALSISATILMIIIINIDIDNNNKKDKIPEYPMASTGRVIEYKE